MFNWYRRHRTNKIEKEMKSIIRYNEYVIEDYKAYPNSIPKPDEFKNNYGICSCFGEHSWPTFKKYGVDEKLFNAQLHSYEVATQAYDSMCEIIKIEEEIKKDNKKVELYKRAILELKSEGKLHI